MLDGVDLRYVKLGEVELVRRIYAAVRDQNWNTIPGVAVNSELDVREDGFDVRFDVRHANDELDFSWQGTISGTADGRVSFSLDGRAGRDFPYNRIGFCVLHPWRETAGARYRGETPDGPIEGQFPLSVGPQDFVDGLYVSLFPAVSRLELDVAEGITALFEFEGDLFECEDQRNWTDASFKTYCTPLALGLPHRATAGFHVAQTVTVSARGCPPGDASIEDDDGAHGRPGDRCHRAADRARPPGGRAAAVRARGEPPAGARPGPSAGCPAPRRSSVARRARTGSRDAPQRRSRSRADPVPPRAARGRARTAGRGPGGSRASLASSSLRKVPGRPHRTRRRRPGSCASSGSGSGGSTSRSQAAPTCTSAR